MPVRLFHPLVFSMLLASGLTWISPVACTAPAQEAGQESRVFVPAPPKGKGDRCVADTDFMRRYHMTLLDHQRDGTVYEGIRTKRFSLKNCIACHAVEGPDARPVTIKSPKHFCRVCHDYAAVRIDCFECHTSRPEPGKAAGLADSEKQHNALASYLKEARQ